MVSVVDIRHELDLYRRLTGARLRGQMRYKTSFVLQIAGNFAMNFLELVTIFILFSHFDRLGDWDRGEIAFLYGMSATPFAIAHVLSSGFNGFQSQIIRGDFDRLMTRPVSLLVQVLASDFRLHQIGRVLQGAVAVGIGLSLTGVDWTIGRVLYLPVAMASTVVLFTALFALEATMCFWTTQGTEVVNAFTYGGTTVAQYPIHIYDAWLRRLFLYIVPIGFTVYAPALYLLDKDDPLGLPDAARFLAPVAAVAFAVVAGLLWRTGVRRYRSTGS